MVKDRLPNMTKYYDTENGTFKYDKVTLAFYNNDGVVEYPSFWFESIREPNDKEIINQIPKDISTDKKQGFYIGFKKCLELLKG